MTKKDLILSFLIGVIVAFFVPIILYSLNFKIITFTWIKFYLISFTVFPLGAMAAFYLGMLASKMWLPLIQVVKFAEVGTMNTIIDFGIINSLIILTGHGTGAWVVLFNTISFSLAVVNSYFWSKNWTFKESASTNSISKFMQFFLVTLVGLVLSDGIIYLFQWLGGPVSVSANQWVNISKVLATAVSLVWNFLGYKFIVFSENKKLSVTKD